MATADFDNDNQSDDILVVNKDTNNILVLINFSSEKWMRPRKFIPRALQLANVAAVGDFNNDGHSHIVTANYENSSVGILRT